MLHFQKRAGEIIEIKVEDHLYLTDAKIGYVVDFRCSMANGAIHWIEAKGFPNDVWPIKKKLWLVYGPGPLYIYKGTHLRPLLDEVVEPRPVQPEFHTKEQ